MTVQGTVMSASVRAEKGYIPSYIVSVTYTYVANGEYYSGCHEKILLRKGSAETFASRVKNQLALVRYKPNQPAISTLIESDQIGWAE
ncbi:MAG: DUF3592 domain-containing protein [Terriglobales bacterium]